MMMEDLTVVGKGPFGYYAMYKWHMDSETALHIPEWDSTGYYWRGPKASQNGIMFCLGGLYEGNHLLIITSLPHCQNGLPSVDKTEVFQDAKWTYGEQYKNVFGCATFVPDNDNYVYVIGGTEYDGGPRFNNLKR